MKLSELTKAELCELVKSMQGVNSLFTVRHCIYQFLCKRFDRKTGELLDALDKVNIVTDFEEFKEINKKLDELHNNAEYYLQLDELNGNFLDGEQ